MRERNQWQALGPASCFWLRSNIDNVLAGQKELVEELLSENLTEQRFAEIRYSFLRQAHRVRSNTAAHHLGLVMGPNSDVVETVRENLMRAYESRTFAEHLGCKVVAGRIHVPIGVPLRILQLVQAGIPIVGSSLVYATVREMELDCELSYYDGIIKAIG